MHSHTEFHGYFYGLEELINKANTRCDDENDVLVFLECKEHWNNVGLGWAFRAEKTHTFENEKQKMCHPALETNLYRYMCFVGFRNSEHSSSIHESYQR